MSNKIFTQLQLDVKQNIGKGSFSNVKKAWSAKRKQAVALKIITLSPIEKDNNEQEFDILTQTHHPNIISIYQLATTAKHMYIVMELAEKGDLLRRLKTKGKLEDTEARRMFRQILEAVNYLHKELNVAHRDLKCENILLDRCENAKLGDFSFAKICIEDDLSRTYCGSIMANRASLGYAAPEVLLHKPYDPKLSDIWSLGVLLFSMVSATLPYSGEFVSSVLIQQRAIVHFDKILPPNSTAYSLISLLLKIKPKHRITYHKILETDWLRDTDYVYYYGTDSPKDVLPAVNSATQTSASFERKDLSPESRKVFRRVKIANDAAKIKQEKQVSPSRIGKHNTVNDNKTATTFSSNLTQEETQKPANKTAKDLKKEVKFSENKESKREKSATFELSSPLSVTQNAPNDIPPELAQAPSKRKFSKLATEHQSELKQHKVIEHEQNGEIDNSDGVNFCPNTDAVDAVSKSFRMLRTILQATKRSIDQKRSERSSIRKSFLESKMGLHSVPEESVAS